MQIVIDIIEEMWDWICNGSPDEDDGEYAIAAVQKGTPLPKGHGRLIDADKYRKILLDHHDFFVNAYGGFSHLPQNDKARVDEIGNCIAEIYNIPTVLEADKEGE